MLYVGHLSKYTRDGKKLMYHNIAATKHILLFILLGICIVIEFRKTNKYVCEECSDVMCIFIDIILLRICL